MFSHEYEVSGRGSSTSTAAVSIIFRCTIQTRLLSLEAATGKPWVRYWLHNEFLLMDSGKMSKSKGGFLTLQSLIDEGYDPLDYRYFLLGAHYRTQLRFSFENLNGARSARNFLVERVGDLLSSGAVAGEITALSDRGKTYLENFRADLEANLNTPKALATLWAVLKDKDLPADDVLTLLNNFDQVLGLRLSEIKAAGEYVLSPEEKALVEERNLARKEKNFARADEIRDYFTRKGLVLTDTPDGTVVKPSEV